MQRKQAPPESLPISRRPSFWLSVARWIASGVNSVAHFIPLLIASLFSRRLAWTIYRHWGRYTFRIFGITLSLRDDNQSRAQSEPDATPHLYVWLNQSSLVEAVAFAQLLPRWYTIGNIEYALMPLLGWALALTGNIVIVRQWKWQAKRGIERAATRLGRGENWLISIEGARSPDGRLLPYKKGPAVMALRSQATIIPMFVHGARDVLPHGEWRVRPGHIAVHLHEAIPTRGLSYEDRGAMLERLRALAEREFRQTQATWAAGASGSPATLPVLDRQARGLRSSQLG